MTKGKYRPSDIVKKTLDIPSERWPEIWQSLNRFEWHEALGEKPEAWDSMDIDQKYSLIHEPMSFIKQMVGEKALLRQGFRKDGRGFEDWWDSRAVEQLFKKLDDIGRLCKEIAQNSTEKGVEQSKAFVFSLLLFLLGLLLGLLL